MGISMGAAVALQAAPRDPRICALVADASFTDLRTAIEDRAGMFTQSTIDAAIRHAELRGHFNVDGVSPLRSALNIHVPVLLLHGSLDDETPPRESQAILDAIPDPRKRLVLIAGAGHDDVFTREETWRAIADWLKTAISPAAPPSDPGSTNQWIGMSARA